MRTRFLNHFIVLLAIAFLAACASPHMSAEMEAGKMAFQKGDYPKAFHDLLPVAKSGRPEAEYAVGYMYYYGYGVPRDLSAGMFWIGRSAAQHYPPADQALERIRQENATREESTSSAQLYQKPSTASAVMPKQISKKIKKTTVSKQKPHRAHAARHEQMQVQPSAQSECVGQATRYVLQLYGSWQRNNVTRIRKQMGLTGEASICVTQRNAKSWYVLVMGAYANMPAAKKAKAELPARLKAVHPWIRDTHGLSAAEL